MAPPAAKRFSCLYVGLACALLCGFFLTSLTLYGRPTLEYYVYKSAAASASEAAEVAGGGVHDAAPEKAYPVYEPGAGQHSNNTSSTPSAEVVAQETYRDEYLAVCLAVKDQGRDLPEFLQHHYYNMGIRRFYILDDGSSPPMSSLASTFGVPASALTFVYYPASQRLGYMQLAVYDACARVHGAHHTWLAFIDADEFLDTPGGETLEAVLRGLEEADPDVGALGVNWQMHASGGRRTRAQSVRQAYTECIYDDAAHGGEGSDNKHVKSIVRVADYAWPVNPHKFALRGGAKTVGEHGDVVEHFAFRQPVTRDRVALHHYAVKSREEYEEKMARSNAMSQPKGWAFWDHVEYELPHVECRDMARWV